MKKKGEWLPHKDSNLNKQNQNLRCYRYTMRQSWLKTGNIILNSDVECKGEKLYNFTYGKI